MQNSKRRIRAVFFATSANDPLNHKIPGKVAFNCRQLHKWDGIFFIFFSYITVGMNNKVLPGFYNNVLNFFFSFQHLPQSDRNIHPVSCLIFFCC